MYKSTFKLLLRTNKKNTIDFLFTILAFSAGLLMFFLLLSHNYYHLSFDNFHHDSDKIYRVHSQSSLNSEESKKSALSAGGVSHLLSENFSNIEATTQLMPASYGVQLKLANNSFTENKGFYVGGDFNEVFDYSILYGNPKTMFDDVNAIAITKSLALKYFGKVDVLGQEISLDDGFGSKNVVITGIYDNVPSNTHLQFDLLISGKYHKYWDYFIGAEENYFYTYVKAQNELSNAQLSLITESSENLDKSESTITLEKIRDIHLLNTIDFDVAELIDPILIQILWLVIIFVLIIALVNFVNINTAQAIDNSKLFAIQKVLGNTAEQSFLLADSLLKSMLSFVFASVIFYLLKEDISYILGFEFSNELLLFSGTITILITIVSGLISSLFSIIAIRKGTLLEGEKSLRGRRFKGSKSYIMILEFSLVIIFIIGATIVWQQLSFINNQKLGYEKENVLIINPPPGVNNEAFYQFTNSFHNVAYIKSHAIAQFSFHSEYAMLPFTENPNHTINAEWNMVDKKYFSTLNIELKEGRFFTNLRDTTCIIVNEVAAAMLSNQEIINNEISTELYFFENTKFKVIGVIKDFHHNSFKKKISPVVYFLNPYEDFVGELAVKYEANSLNNLLPVLETLWKEKGMEASFEYKLMKDGFELQNKDENRLSKIANIALIIVMLISAFGLFSFLRYYISHHTKELAIRRVLGAHYLSIYATINKPIAYSLLISFTLAVPMSYFLMTDWLESFQYRTQIEWYVFLLPLVCFSAIILSIGIFQLLKVISTNPSTILKND